MTNIKPGDHVRHLHRPYVHGVVTHVKPVARGRVGVYLHGRRGAYSPDLLQPVEPAPSPRYVVATHAEGDHGVLDLESAPDVAFAGFGWWSTEQENQRTADRLNAGSDRGRWRWRAYDPPAGDATDEPEPVAPSGSTDDDGWWDLDPDANGNWYVYGKDADVYGLEVRVQARRRVDGGR